MRWRRAGMGEARAPQGERKSALPRIVRASASAAVLPGSRSRSRSRRGEGDDKATAKDRTSWAGPLPVAQKRSLRRVMSRAASSPALAAPGSLLLGSGSGRQAAELRREARRRSTARWLQSRQRVPAAGPWERGGPRHVSLAEGSGIDAVLHRSLDALDPSGEAVKLFFEAWLRRYAEDERSFGSVAVFCEVKMRELFRMTDPLPRPNVFRTWVCFDLMMKLVRSLADPRARRVMGKVMEVLMAAVYTDERGEVGLVPYSVRARELEAERRATQLEHDAAARHMGEVQERWRTVLSKWHPAFERAIRHWTVPVSAVVFQAWRRWAAERRLRRGDCGRALTFSDKVRSMRRRHDVRTVGCLVMSEWRAVAVRGNLQRLAAERARLTAENADLQGAARRARRLKYALKDRLETVQRELDDSLEAEAVLRTRVGACVDSLAELSAQRQLARRVVDMFLSVAGVVACTFAEQSRRLLETGAVDPAPVGAPFGGAVTRAARRSRPVPRPEGAAACGSMTPVYAWLDYHAEAARGGSLFESLETHDRPQALLCPAPLPRADDMVLLADRVRGVAVPVPTAGAAAAAAAARAARDMERWRAALLREQAAAENSSTDEEAAACAAVSPFVPPSGGGEDRDEGGDAAEERWPPALAPQDGDAVAAARAAMRRSHASKVQDVRADDVVADTLDTIERHQTAIHARWLHDQTKDKDKVGGKKGEKEQEQHEEDGRPTSAAAATGAAAAAATGAAPANFPQPVRDIDWDQYDAVACILAASAPGMPADTDDVLLAHAGLAEVVNTGYERPARVSSYRQMEDILESTRAARAQLQAAREAGEQSQQQWRRAVDEACQDVTRRLLERINLEDSTAGLDVGGRACLKRYTRATPALTRIVLRSRQAGGPDESGAAGAAEKDVEACETVLGRHFVRLRAAFRHACAAQSGGAGEVTMSSFQFWRVVRRAGLPCKACPSASIEVAYRDKIAAKRRVWEAVSSDVAPPSFGLTFDDFVEVLAEVGNRRFADDREGAASAGAAAPSERRGLASRLRRTLELALGNLERRTVQRTVNEFRESIASSQAEQMFERHGKFLGSVFAAYASSGGFMSVDDFCEFCTDADLMRRNILAFRTVKELFEAAQFDEEEDEGEEEEEEEDDDDDDDEAEEKDDDADDADGGETGVGGDGDKDGGEDSEKQGGTPQPEDTKAATGFGGDDNMVYYEFLESVAALSCFVCKNPYLPLENKVDFFVTQELQKSDAIEKRRQSHAMFRGRRR